MPPPGPARAPTPPPPSRRRRAPAAAAACVGLAAGLGLGPGAGPAAARDRFGSIAELAAATREGVDWRVEARPGRTDALVLAPHGGGIEPGTSELARAVAGERHALYLFEGLRGDGNGELHVTSTRFEEPRLTPLLAQAARVLALHGCVGDEPAALLGGRDEALVARLGRSLRRAGVEVRPAPADLGGESPRNVCNRGRSGRGAQVELTRGLRASLFAGLGAAGRARPTPRFAEVVAALRAALEGGD